MASLSTKVPTAFASYAWETQAQNSWVHDFATRLRGLGVDVMLDQWHAAPGDQLPAFMERAVRLNDYVLIICTPKYKSKSDARRGGVGYEGDVMTAEVMSTGNQRKFIPILRAGDWIQSAPSWLAGKYHIDLRGDPYSEVQFNDLVLTIHGRRPEPPPLGNPPILNPLGTPPSSGSSARRSENPSSFIPIRIEGIIVDEVTSPRNDGTPGCALYAVPFQLSRTPPHEWGQLFISAWDHPPSFTSRHRPGIAEVYADRVVLNGTTVEEIEEVHRETLKVVRSDVNTRYAQWEAIQSQREEASKQREVQHENQVRDAAKRMRFDDF